MGAGRPAGAERLRALGLAVALGAALAGGVAPAHAASPPTPPPSLSEFHHVRWDVSKGAPSRINTLTQSADGFLWIGGVEGLTRFDGVTFERVTAQDPKLRRMVVSALATARDGAVWVGLARGGGLAVWREGRLASAGMPNPSREVNDIAEDRQGGIWVARGGRTQNTVAQWSGGRWREYGTADGLPEQQAWQVLPTRDGALWVVASDTVVVRRPGAARFAPTKLRTTTRASLAEDPAGGLWLSDAAGVRRVTADGPAGPVYPRSAPAGGARTLFDRSGALWGAALNGGLFRIPAPGRSPTLETLGAAEGLTSDQARPIFQDREGSIWIGTELGLDMFRPARVVSEPAIPANSPASYRIAATRNGTVFVGDATAVYAIRPGEAPQPVLRTPSAVEALCAAEAGGVWAVLAEGLVRVDAGAAERRPKPPGVTAQACAEDAYGRLWLPALNDGLHVWEKGRWRAAADGGASPAGTVLTPWGAVAVSYRGRPASPTDPLVQVFAERFGVGGVEGMSAGLDALYVGGAEGLGRLRGGEIRTLSAKAYPWLASVNGLVQTGSGETWTIGDAGIVRMNSGDLGRAFARGGPLPHQLFDYRDGLNSFVQKTNSDQAAAGGDGRLWFLTRRNVVRIDPVRLAINDVPPPVVIRSVSSGGRAYDAARQVELPAGATTLSIAYTALSLAEPSRVQFRYRLDGVDKGWMDPGGRRSALYVNLGPGRYRFRVIAANDDGVWNRTGDTLDVRIPPTPLQTWWLRSLIALAAVALLSAAVRWRVRAATAATEARLSERQAERLRIARELHDTLLQGVQGLLIRFQVVANALPEGEPAKPMMEAVLDRAEEILVEGRDRVRDLRAEQDAGSQLVVELTALAYELERDYGTPINVTTNGACEPLAGEAHREIFAIAREALLNAVRHAGASAIACEVTFGRRRLELVVRDNGGGLPPEVQRLGGRSGHWGLKGMAERARLIGGRLQLRSGSDGVTVRLTAPMRLLRAGGPQRWRLPWRR